MRATDMGVGLKEDTPKLTTTLPKVRSNLEKTKQSVVLSLLLAVTDVPFIERRKPPAVSEVTPTRASMMPRQYEYTGKSHMTRDLGSGTTWRHGVGDPKQRGQSHRFVFWIIIKFEIKFNTNEQ